MKSNFSKALMYLIPGIIVYILALYYLNSINGFSGDSDVLNYGITLLIALLITVLYNFSKLSSVVTNYKKRKIELLIKTTLFSLYTSKVTNEQKQYLFAEERLMNIFFELINENDALRGKEVKGNINEIIWTSLADLGILSLFCSIAFFVSIFFFPEIESELIIKGFGISLLSIIALAAHNLSFIKLIDLSNKVLVYIENNLINQLDQKIKNTLS
ncbi:hypothetical protein [Lutimonas zeaxanthinifaciens]|uniref:hypothetical protein n=1 Tax=Lutimonas zeaxanthinifaciens TaxID=3060215 RepID=UPI00265C901C|nr:hypothetical protein [Lutimonas sp. YSD2104]WKK66346.1 hypothetical protein QZH61_01700 [Lutimonas sp. YSD2104]